MPNTSHSLRIFIYQSRITIHFGHVSAKAGRLTAESEMNKIMFMTPDLRQYLAAIPFVPFSIVMSSGRRYPIPTADHAGLDPSGKRAVVWFDDGSGVTISAIHITAIEENGSDS